MDDFGQAAAVADGQGVLAPDPIEAFLGHAECNDHVHVVAVVLVRGVFQRLKYTRAHSRVAVVHQVCHFQGATVFGGHQVEACVWGHALPFAKAVHDVAHLALLVLQAFARVDVWDVNDGLQRWVEHLGDGIHIRAGVEEVANVQRLEPLIAVELLIVGVSHRLELRLIGRAEHGLAVASEVGARHGHQVHLVACNERP